MPYEFRLPRLTEDTEEAVVVAWFKPLGAEVKKGETVVEVQMAKVSFDVPSPVAGRLAQILAPRDAIVRQGETLALILEVGEMPAPSAPSETTTAAAETPRAASPQVSVIASPAAKRLARERGIDLATVRGSGEGGRITEEDVRKSIDSVVSAAPAVPLSGMRGAIAQRMRDSLRATAQLTLFTDADVTELVALKSQANVTYTDLVIKAAALSLREQPRLNAWLIDNEVRLQPGIDIGVAVALEEGLIVPVVRGADRRAVGEISVEMRRLAEGARAGTLTPGEVTGSTFSVTNLGMFGVDAFTPILNPPEIAILGIGRITERAVRRDEGIDWRSFMTLSLTFDHSAVDGAPAARFLQTVCRHLANPGDLVKGRTD